MFRVSLASSMNENLCGNDGGNNSEKNNILLGISIDMKHKLLIYKNKNFEPTVII